MSAPAFVGVTPGIRSLEVSWSTVRPSSPACAVTGYRVHVTASDAPPRAVDYPVAPGVGESVKFDGFNDGSTVCVTVAALSGGAEGPVAAPTPNCVQLPALPPPPMEVVLHVTADGFAHVFWTPFSQLQPSFGYPISGYLVNVGSASTSLSADETHVDLPAVVRGAVRAEVRSVSAVGVGHAMLSDEWDGSSLWHFAGTLTAPQASLPAIVVGDRIFLLGGGVGGGTDSAVTRVRGDGTLDVPTPLGLHLGRSMAAASVALNANDAIAFLSGGTSDPFGLTAVRLSANGTADVPISVGKPMPADRDGARAEIIDGHLYVLGGISAPERDAGHGPTASVLSCAVTVQPAPDCGEWVEQRPLPSALFGFATAVIGRHLYAIGGFADSRPSATVFVVTSGADGVLREWKRTSAPLPAPLVGAEAVTWNGSLLIVGGGADWDGGTPTNQILVGRPDASGDIKAWSSVPGRLRLIGSRLDPSVAVVSGNLYVIGGRLETPLGDMQSIGLDTLTAIAP